MRSPAWIRRARPLAGIAVACSVAACSLLTSLDGLSGGVGDAGAESSVVDGAPAHDSASGAVEDTGSTVSAGDAAGDDAGPDSSLADSSPTDSSLPTADGSDADKSPGTDASKDTGPDAPPREAAPPPYCASLSPAPLFCDDFDEGALATPWDQLVETDGTASLDGTFYESPPNAMLASVTASAPAGNVEVAGYKSLTAKQGIAGVYTLAFDIRVDAADTSSASDAVLGAIQLWNGTTTWDLELEVSYGGAADTFDVSLTEDSSTDYAQHAASVQLKTKTWTHVSIAITLPAGTGSPVGSAAATLSLGGAQVVSATVNVTTTDPIPEVILGPTYATPASTGWAVRYDNLTFD